MRILRNQPLSGPDAFIAQEHRDMNQIVDLSWRLASIPTYCWCHLALFRLAQGQLDGALALYDGHVRAGRSG